MVGVWEGGGRRDDGGRTEEKLKSRKPGVIVGTGRTQRGRERC